MTCSASKFGIGLNDFCQLRAPLHEWVAGQIAPVHLQHIEGVEDNSMPRMQASVLESLKRWASGLIDRHDLSVDDRLVGTYTPSSGGDGRVHANQALLAPGPHRDRVCVPHQESPVPILYPPRICYYRATRKCVLAQTLFTEQNLPQAWEQQAHAVVPLSRSSMEDGSTPAL